MRNAYFVFREVRTLGEIRSLFRLRYRVYRNCALQTFVKENPSEIDLDVYDLRARHFGLFKKNYKPVGYMRVVEDSATPPGSAVERLAGEFPRVREQISEAPEMRNPFPLMSYCPEADRIRKIYDNAKVNGGRMVEPGRLALDESCRSRKLGQHLIESAIAVYFCTYCVDYAILGCTPRHSAIYGKFGFRRIMGTSEYKMGKIVGCALISTPQNLPLRAHQRVTRMAAAFQSTDQICYNPANPENFYAPVKRVATAPTAVRVAA